MIDTSEEEATMEIQLGPEEGRVTEEATHFDEQNPRIINCEPQTALVEELKSFVVDFHDRSKSLQVDKGLLLILKENRKGFQQSNLDVFAQKHKDMVEIDPKISCRHLKIDPKASFTGKKEEP